MRERATRRAEAWMLERLNGEDGLGAIFPAMVNALEAMVILGYAADDPRRVTAKRALQKLLVVGPSSAYCQPCVSPVWDTALAAWPCRRPAMPRRSDASMRALDWLQDAAAARRARRLAGQPPGACRAAAGRFNSRTATTRISTTRPWSPGPCIRRRDSAPLRRERAPRARLAGRHAEQGRRLRRLRCRQHLLLPQQDSVRRSRRAARSADERCHRARGDGAGAHRPPAGPGGAGARDRLPARGSRKPTAPGSAAGAPTTSTAPGRC